VSGKGGEKTSKGGEKVPHAAIGRGRWNFFEKGKGGKGKRLAKGLTTLCALSRLSVSEKKERRGREGGRMGPGQWLPIYKKGKKENKNPKPRGIAHRSVSFLSLSSSFDEEGGGGGRREG